MTNIETQVERAVDMVYRMNGGGRSFWPLAQEIIRRIMTTLDAVRDEERERCAKIAEAEAEKSRKLKRAFDADDYDLSCHEWYLAVDAADAIAAAIRKGEAP